MPDSPRQFKDLQDSDFELPLELNLRAILGLPRWVAGGGWHVRSTVGRLVIIGSESWRIGLNYDLSNYVAAEAAALSSCAAGP